MEKPFYVAGEWRSGEESFDVLDPFDGSLVARVGVPTADDVDRALTAAWASRAQCAQLPVHTRAEALMHISRRLAERLEEVAMTIVREGGKPISVARAEASRAVSTFRWAAEECRRSEGELLRLDTEAALGSRLALVRRFPLGPVLAITPFNFPVNLVAHKLAPAVAVGAPIVVKPATKTPLGALLLAELVSETDLPEEMLSVLPLEAERAEALVEDDRFAKVSFTGSSAVGWRLRAKAPRKSFTLELGGNAGVIVHSDADLDHAVERIAYGGYYQSGQSCVSVQRIWVHRGIEKQFVSALTKRVGELVVGDPKDEKTDVGPLIDRAALDRVYLWVKEALEGGAEALVGGDREDPAFQPTVLTGTRSEMKVRCEEIFGPVTVIESYDDFGSAIAEVNDTQYGLQAGLFTSDLQRIMIAHRELQVGGVIVNDVSSFRADQMPYGGTKGSGTGREGLRYAMHEMTEPRILVLSHVPL